MARRVLKQFLDGTLVCFFRPFVCDANHQEVVGKRKYLEIEWNNSVQVFEVNEYIIVHPDLK